MSQDKTVWSLEYRGHLAGVGAGTGRITTFTSFSLNLYFLLVSPIGQSQADTKGRESLHHLDVNALHHRTPGITAVIAQLFTAVCNGRECTHTLENIGSLRRGCKRGFISKFGLAVGNLGKH